MRMRSKKEEECCPWHRDPAAQRNPFCTPNPALFALGEGFLSPWIYIHRTLSLRTTVHPLAAFGRRVSLASLSFFCPLPCQTLLACRSSLPSYFSLSSSLRAQTCLPVVDL